MELNVAKELAALRNMTVGELRAKYAEVYGETTNGRHKIWLVKRIIWRMQALAEGDLSERARLRAAELANDADLRRKPPKLVTATANVESRNKIITSPVNGSRLPPSGSTITRPYKGQQLEVAVLSDGFEFEGEQYKSLSAVAKKITGSHCNGFHFFRLNGSAR